VRTGYFLDGCGLRRREFLGERIALARHALGDADDRRERTRDDLIPFVGHALGHETVGGGLVGQPAHLAEVWQPQQLGEFWPHLPRFSIRAVAPAENQVGLFSGQQQGQGARCGQRIRAR